MELITGGGTKVRKLTQETLDQLWYEAEGLGKVEVDHLIGDSAYRVQIQFKRKSGTTIWAQGSDQSIHVALGNAINEARERGAGEVQ